MSAAGLRAVLDRLPVETDPNLLVGHNLADDAGVYRLDDETALVQTVDFFPPVVDDPFDFGRVAAANALSDVYAMGGRPLTALNIAAFPDGELDYAVLATILEGGNQVVREAGAIVVGGHTISDKEIKYGLSVTGLVHPSKVMTNSGAKPGDALILTKPIGSGVLTTALRAEKLEQKTYEELIATMTQLNRDASENMLELGASACTDVTGFGLLGHAFEMVEASGVTLEIQSTLVPLMTRALDYAREGHLTGGGGSNRLFLEKKIERPASLDESLSHLLFDPQTSGGLLISIHESKSENLLAALKKNHPLAARIGTILPRQTRPIIIK
jgi:selenide,water dikinase